MATAFLILVVVLVLAALVFGVVSLLAGDDPGLSPAEPDGRAVPLPNNRSLTEIDLKAVKFDLAWRGYRMAQVDWVLRRTAYDIGYKDEMIAVLEAEVQALRDGRNEDAELLRGARESAASPGPATPIEPIITLNTPESWELSRAGDDLDPVDTVPLGSTRGRDGSAGGFLRPDAATATTATGASSQDEATGVFARDEDEVVSLEEARLEAARREAATPGTLADRATRKHASTRGKNRGPRPAAGTGQSDSATRPDTAPRPVAGPVDSADPVISAEPLVVDKRGSSPSADGSSGTAGSTHDAASPADGDSVVSTTDAAAGDTVPPGHNASANGGAPAITVDSEEPAEPSSDRTARA